MTKNVPKEKKKDEKDDVIVLDESGKEDYDLGREDLDLTGDDDDSDFEDDIEFDDGGD